MGVICGNVILLRGRNSQTRAGREEEFINGDIRRQRARVQRERICELRIPGKEALGDRGDEAPFEIAVAARLLERQRGEDAKADRWIGGRAGEQRVGDVIGFAEPERQRQRDRFADASDDLVGHALRICERDRSAAAMRNANPVRHSGRAAIAARAGIHNHGQRLWIPGSRAAPAPRNDEPELTQVRVISGGPNPRRAGSARHSVASAVRARRGCFPRRAFARSAWARRGTAQSR